MKRTKLIYGILFGVVAVMAFGTNADARCIYKGKQLGNDVTYITTDTTVPTTVQTGYHSDGNWECTTRLLTGQTSSAVIVAPGATYEIAFGSFGTGPTCGSTSMVHQIACNAHMVKNTFNVVYNNGGGSGSAPSGPTNCTYGATCKAPANTYTAPPDTIFNGWACKKSDNSSCGTFLPGASISTATSTNNDTITLTAQWVSNLNMKTMTSKKYVDDELAKKQPQFSGLGNNKLMLYSNATNGATLSRDIVTELGTSTSANTVPTVGAINTVLETKQDKLNGTAGWVVENTGTAGNVRERPVYNTTDNYMMALVEADDLNQMVINAVNSELTQVADGWRVNDSVTLPTLRVLLPDVNIDATSYYDKCNRSLVGSDYDYDGNCSATVLAVLGATNSKSGKWAALFPYGDIVGKSVCSVTAGNEYGTATEAQESTLNADFNAQSGVGESALNSNQKNYCWCNIESIMGQSVVSGWAMPYDGAHFTSALNCARSCAGFCSGIINDDNFRSLMFSTIQ